MIGGRNKESAINVLYTILAILAIVAGVVGTLTILVMLMAGGANSTPEQIQAIKMWMLIVSLGGLACVVGGGFLVYQSHPIIGALVGSIPLVTVVGGIIWLGVAQSLSR